MLKKNKELIGAWVVLAVAVLLFILSFLVQRNTVSTVGPGFMPRLVSILLFILGLLNLRNTIRNNRTTSKEDNETVSPEKKTLKDFLLDNLDWASSILILLYVFSIGTLGFPIASILYMFLQMIVLSHGQKRNWILFVLLSIAVPVAIYFAFTKCFYLMLPAGILG